MSTLERIAFDSAMISARPCFRALQSERGRKPRLGRRKPPPAGNFALACLTRRRGRLLVRCVIPRVGWVKLNYFG